MIKKIVGKVQQRISTSGSDLSSDSGSGGSGYGGFQQNQYSPPHGGGYNPGYGGYSGTPNAAQHHNGFGNGAPLGYPSPASPAPQGGYAGYPAQPVGGYGSPYSGNTPLTGPPPPIVPNAPGTPLASESSGSPGTPIANNNNNQSPPHQQQLQRPPNRFNQSPSPAPQAANNANNNNNNNNNNVKPPQASPATPSPKPQVSPVAAAGGAYSGKPAQSGAAPGAPQQQAPALAQQAKPHVPAPLPPKPAAAVRPAHNAVAGAGALQAVAPPVRPSGGAGAAANANVIFVNDRSKVELLRQLEVARREGWVSEEQYQLGVKAILGSSGGSGGAASPSPSPALPSGGGAYAASDLFSLPHCPVETVTKRWFEWRSQKWMSEQIKVQIDTGKHFAEGNLRLAYKSLDLSRKPGQRAFVAKRQKDKCFDREGAFNDVIMQEECREWARKFNALNPPKRVDFVEAFLIERNAPGLRTAEKLYAMEPFMSGKYSKHNNNWGWVAPEDRNTPQAFSHFTWEKSNNKLIIVDIQGVGDSYTDPQVHTVDGKGYGAGNMGAEGIGKFLSSHKCSNICKALGLPVYNLKAYDVGTQPMRATGKPVQKVG